MKEKFEDTKGVISAVIQRTDNTMVNNKKKDQKTAVDKTLHRN